VALVTSGVGLGVWGGGMELDELRSGAGLPGLAAVGA